MKHTTRLISLFLVIVLYTSMLTYAAATDTIASPNTSQDEITVEYMLEQLESGNATEVFEIIEPAASVSPSSTYDGTKSGTTYVDTITDASGNTLEYKLTPIISWECEDIASGANVTWYTKLYLSETVKLNGEYVNGYMNRIKLKNIRGEMGVGENLQFRGEATVAKQNISSISVNSLAVLASLVSTKYSTASALLSALSSISYTSGTTGSSVSVKTNANLVGAKFASAIELYESNQSLSIQCNVGVKDDSLSDNTISYFAFKWTYSVYTGSSKVTDTNLSKTGTAKSNYVKS